MAGARCVWRQGHTTRPVHPHATIYRQVGIASSAGLSAAGDAVATAAAIADGRCALQDDPHWGWVGRIGGSRELEGLAARVVSAACDGLAPSGRWAVGMGSSKGDISGLLAGTGPWSTAPGGLSMPVARQLGIGYFVPCATAAACSTGLACLLGGADLIERGQVDQAIVGAAESSLQPLVLAGFANAGVLCGRTLPQALAIPTGFAPAEGAAAFVLVAGPKTPPGGWRLRAGVRLGDAGHETHFLDPRTLTTALSALWDILPGPDLIVCHATGTVAGDAYELAGLEAGPWRICRRLVCKPWIGHSLGASGALELAIGLAGGGRRLWKLSLGFGGHLVAVALDR